MRLERKIKRDLLGTKHITELGDMQVAGLSREQLAAHLEAQRANPVDIDLRLRNPVIRNRYLREYFVDASKRVRITVDREQAFYSVDSHHDVLRGNRVDYPVYVIELKYDKENLPLVKQLMDGFPLRPVRHSKYLAGLSRMIEQPYY